MIKIYTFDDVCLGLSANNRQTVTTRLLLKPKYISLKDWYDLAPKICRILRENTL